MALQSKLFSRRGALRTELLLLSRPASCWCKHCAFDAGLGTLATSTTLNFLRATSRFPPLVPATFCCGQDFWVLQAEAWTSLSLWRSAQLHEQSPGELRGPWTPRNDWKAQLPKANPQKSLKVPEICAGKCMKQGSRQWKDWLPTAWFQKGKKKNPIFFLNS